MVFIISDSRQSIYRDIFPCFIGCKVTVFLTLTIKVPHLIFILCAFVKTKLCLIFLKRRFVTLKRHFSVTKRRFRKLRWHLRKFPCRFNLFFYLCSSLSGRNGEPKRLNNWLKD
jgi:hypothetical protein